MATKKTLKRRAQRKKRIELMEEGIPYYEDSGEDMTFTDGYSSECNKLPEFITPTLPVCTFNDVPVPGVYKKGYAPEYITVTINEDEDNTMDTHIETDQRNYMKRRLDDLKYEKRNALRTKFYMDTVPTIKSKADLLALLANPKAIEFSDWYYEKDGTLRQGYHFAGTFSIIDPQRDSEGYKAAEKLLDIAATAAKDAIIVKPLSDALTALQAFEAQTF